MSHLLPERYGDFTIPKLSPKKSVDFFEWQKPRNVIDEFKSLDNDTIRQQVKNKTLPFAIMMAQIEGDFNFSSLVRSANFLGAQHIFFFGKKHWNKVGACGSYLYKDITFLSSFDDIGKLKQRYRFVGLENNLPNVQNLTNYVWNKNSLLIVGEENAGIPPEIIHLCDDVVEIVGRGSVRSMNAAVAGTIAMFDYTSKLVR